LKRLAYLAAEEKGDFVEAVRFARGIRRGY
jgi:hypothetical protein